MGAKKTSLSTALHSSFVFVLLILPIEWLDEIQAEAELRELQRHSEEERRIHQAQVREYETRLKEAINSAYESDRSSQVGLLSSFLSSPLRLLCSL